MYHVVLETEYLLFCFQLQKSQAASSLTHLRELLQSLQRAHASEKVGKDDTDVSTNKDAPATGGWYDGKFKIPSDGLAEGEDTPFLPPLPTLLRQMSDMNDAGLIGWFQSALFYHPSKRNPQMMIISILSLRISCNCYIISLFLWHNSFAYCAHVD